jgi:methionyl-tRNA synthetase
VFAVVRGANRAIEDTRPWALARTEREGNGAAGRQLDTVLYELLECLRLVGEALRPFLPDTAARIAGQLGVAPAEQWTTAFDWGGLDPGTQIGVPVPLFPRRDLGAGVP